MSHHTGQWQRELWNKLSAMCRLYWHTQPRKNSLYLSPLMMVNNNAGVIFLDPHSKRWWERECERRCTEDFCGMRHWKCRSGGQYDFLHISMSAFTENHVKKEVNLEMRRRRTSTVLIQANSTDGLIRLTENKLEVFQVTVFHVWCFTQ